MTFQKDVKVRFQHCDPAGIVFYPRYFEMVNALVEDWFAEMGQPFAAMCATTALVVPTVQFNVTFPAPSRLGEVLTFRLTPVRIGGSSLDLQIEAHEGTQARLTMNTTLVQMSLENRKSAPWSDEIKQKIQEYMKGQSHEK